jgi:hypothetical protein
MKFKEILENAPHDPPARSCAGHHGTPHHRRNAAYYTPVIAQSAGALAGRRAQLAACVPNFLIQERGDNEYSDLLAKPLPPVKDGHRPLLTDPGLGITIDENKLMAQVGEPRPYRTQYDADDGSVVDW